MGIEMKGIYKRFVRTGEGGVAEPFVALSDFNLEIRDQEFVSFIGPSGCGKTTMLRIVDGLTEPDAGTVSIDGKVVKGPGPDRAVVFQSFALMPWATVLDNVGFPLEIKGVSRRDREAIARHCIAQVGLKGFEHAYPHALSGGMQQRAGLARALAVEPRILLMDEPFGAVDAQTRHLLQEELIGIWEQQHQTVVFVTHSMEEAVLLSDRVVIMEPSPGRVAEVLDVPIPRPRDADSVRRSPAFVELSNYVWERLREIILECERRPGCADDGAGGLDVARS